MIIVPKDDWWFGNFPEAVFRTTVADIGIKRLNKDTYVPDPHYHTSSTEYNYVVSGKLNVNGEVVTPGQMFIFQALEISNTQVIEDTVLIVVRFPSAKDKVLV